MKGHPMQTLEQAVAQLQTCRVTLLGDYVLDAYLYGETARVSREAPVMIVRKERLEHRLGGAANTAANLTSLGVRTRVLGLAGDDEAGRNVKSILQERGVDVTHLRLAKDVTTPVKMRVLAGAFGTSKQQVLRIDHEPENALAADLDEVVADDLLRNIHDTDVLVVSDYGMQGIGPKAIQVVRKLCKDGIRVCVDSRYRLRAFQHVSVLTPNIPEAEAAVGFSITDQNAVLRAGSQLVDELRLDACLLTQGRHGMTLFRKNSEPAHIDIVGTDEVTDVTGAGDTVIATFAAALGAGLGMHNGMVLANCAAGIVVTKMGCAQVSPKELIDVATLNRLELKAWDA
jgi:D-glycero-beta-D-manno-heptose-7-phosphate kinase